MRKLCEFLILCSVIMLGGRTADPVVQIAIAPTQFYKEVREDFLIDAEVISFPGDGA